MKQGDVEIRFAKRLAKLSDKPVPNNRLDAKASSDKKI